MNTHSKFSPATEKQSVNHNLPVASVNEQVQPPIGDTPPQELARDAADGRRGAAWRLMIWVLDNDPRAVVAVSSSEDDRLAQNLLEFIAQGTWAGKPFVVPVPLRSAFARTRLRTLFLPGSGMGTVKVMRVLLPALHDSRAAVRANAIHILGLIGRPSEAPLVIRCLQDPDATVRMQAAKALGRIGDVAAVQPLIDALKNANEQLGTQIFVSLVELGNAAVPALNAAYASRSSWIRWHCIRALAQIADDTTLPTLAHALTDPDHGVVWMAAKSLVQTGKLAIKPVLQVLIENETSPWLAETGSYVLHTFYQQHNKYRSYLEPVVMALHGVGFRVAAAEVARKALQQLEDEKLLV